MRRFALGVLVALLVPLLSQPSPGATLSTPGADPERYDTIPNLVLELPDGDRLALGAPNYRRVMVQRFDGATGAWSPPEVLFRERGVECGDLDARSAGGAVAVILECEDGSWYEDQAPTGSVALYSPDTLTWARHELDGEAYEEPGISPNGSTAIWPIGQGRYTTYAAGVGFADHQLRAKGEEYTLTAVVSDSAAISYAFGAPTGDRGRCGLVVLTRTGDGPVARQDVALENACADQSLTNADSNTLVFGDTSSAAYHTTISRTGPGAHFAVTAIEPASAPGLRTYPYARRRAMHQQFFTAPGLPLFAIGSPDRRQVFAQEYDVSAQRWLAPERILRRKVPGCTWGTNDASESLGVIAVDLTCYFGRRDDGYPPQRGGRAQPDNGHLVLTTADGDTWSVLPTRTRTIGVSTDLRVVAVPTPRRTYVVSQERGFVALPRATADRCALIVPAGADSGVMLTPGPGSRGWPARLYVATPGSGWVLDRDAVLPRPARGHCRRVQLEAYDDVGYFLAGTRDGYRLTVTHEGGRWKVRRTRY